jgi:hypothetical protein
LSRFVDAIADLRIHDFAFALEDIAIRIRTDGGEISPRARPRQPNLEAILFVEDRGVADVVGLLEERQRSRRAG